jgi:hypothetical protein
VSLWNTPAIDAQVATVAAVSGGVEVLRHPIERWSPLQPAGELRLFDKIRSNPSGWARLLFHESSVVVLAPSSLLRLEEAVFDGARSRMVLRLLGGQLRVVSSGTVAERGPFEVETPTAVATGRGNQFIVSYDAATRDTDIVAIHGDVAALAVLAVPGSPVALRPGSRTTVQWGAFPSPPAEVTPGQLADLQRRFDFTVRSEDSLLTELPNSQAVKQLPEIAPVEPPRVETPATEPAPQLPRARPRAISRDGEIIDESIRE